VRQIKGLPARQQMSTVEWLKANPLNTQTSQGKANEWQAKLKSLSREERRAFFEEQRASRRKANNKRRGQKAAKTRKRRQTAEKERIETLQATPEGRSLLKAQKALDKIRDPKKPFNDGVFTKEYDNALAAQQRAEDNLKVANAVRSPTAKQKAYDAAQPDFNLDNGNGKTESWRVKGSNKVVQGNRMSDPEATGIPWQIDVYPHEERAYTLAGAKIEPYDYNRNSRSMKLYGVDDKYQYFRLYYPKGDPDASRRARRLVQQIGEGKSQKGMTLTDMGELIWGGPIPNNLGLGSTEYETEWNKGRSAWQKSKRSG